MKPRAAPAEPEGERVFPPPERGQHDQIAYGEVIVFSGDGGRRATTKALVHRVTTQRAIDRLWTNGKLTPKQFDAACRFWTAYHLSGMEGVRAVNLNGAGGGGHGGPAYTNGMRAAWAWAEWRDALEAVPADRRALLRWVVCDDGSLRLWVFKQGRIPSGREVARAGERLGEALDCVVKHWGL